MNDTVIRAGALVDHCVLDKEIEIGAGAQVGVGDDMTPNQLEPGNLDTGITIVGKRAPCPTGAVIGRNCRIDPTPPPKTMSSCKSQVAAPWTISTLCQHSRM